MARHDLSAVENASGVALCRAWIAAEAAEVHPPSIVFAMLFALALVSSMLAGGMAGSKSRSWLHMLCFAVVVAVTAYVILDTSTRD